MLDAARNNNIPEVRYLISRAKDKKAFVNQNFGRGKITALHAAYHRGYDSFAELLLEHGANPSQRDSLGRSAASYKPELITRALAQ